METPKPNQITPKVKRSDGGKRDSSHRGTPSRQPACELRQSKEWGKYLRWLGWKLISINSISIAIRKVPFGSLVKIQRPQNLSEKDLNEIQKICEQNKALFIKIEPSLDQDLDFLKRRGYAKSFSPLLPPTTIYINLKNSEKKLWGNVSKSGKYSINRARREGAKVEFYKNPNEEILKQFYEVSKEAGKDKKFPTPSIKDLKKKVEIFGDRAFVVFVMKDKEIFGGNFYLGVGKNAWFMHGGTSRAGRKGKWGYELVWQSFLYFKKLGYEVLDLEGKDDDRFPTFTKGWGGFSHFKEKFGGEIVKFPYPHIKLLHPALKILQKFYRTLPL